MRPGKLKALRSEIRPLLKEYGLFSDEVTPGETVSIDIMVSHAEQPTVDDAYEMGATPVRVSGETCFSSTDGAVKLMIFQDNPTHDLPEAIDDLCKRHPLLEID